MRPNWCRLCGLEHDRAVVREACRARFVQPPMSAEDKAGLDASVYGTGAVWTHPDGRKEHIPICELTIFTHAPVKRGKSA